MLEKYIQYFGNLLRKIGFFSPLGLVFGLKMIFRTLGQKSNYYFRDGGSSVWQEGITKNFIQGIALDKDIDHKINNMIIGLDSESIDIVKDIIKNMNILYNHNIIDENMLFSKKDRSDRIKLFKNKYKTIEKFQIKLPMPHIETSVFGAYHGLDSIYNEIKDRIKDTNFIDCGGFIGDSSLLFLKKYPFKHAYCFEPSQKNIHYIKQTIELNHLDGKLTIIPQGVASEEGSLYINDSGSGSNLSHNNHYGDKISLTTIDIINNKYQIIPSLIKFDIEGYEYDAILGAKETITKHKPILLISIYHTPKDFFEIKPLIESRGVDYKYKIVRCDFETPWQETMLLCY